MGVSLARRPAAVAADVVRQAVAGVEPRRARIVRSREGVRRTIVVAEVAVSLVLICGAVLMFKSLLKLQRVDAGVRIDNVITMSADLSLADLPRRRDAPTRFIERSRERLRRSPASSAPRSRPTCRCSASGRATRSTFPARRTASARGSSASIRDYFDTLDIPILAGRGFSASDRAGAPRVVMVNEALARRLAERFGIADPAETSDASCGSHTPCTRTAARLGKQEDVEIVGVIRNERVNDLETPMPEVVYVPLPQAPRREIKLIVRTQSEPAAAMPAIREAVREIDPHLPLGDVRTMAAGAAAHAVREDASRRGSSARSPASRRCSPRWASTASCRTP